MFEMDAKGFDKNVSGITHRDENTNIKLNNKIDVVYISDNDT